MRHDQENIMPSLMRRLLVCCRIAAVLEGKGGGKKGRYQGKANTLKTRKAAQDLLKEFSLCQ